MVIEWDLMVIFMVILWWSNGDFYGDFMVIVWWFNGDFVVIL